MSLNTDRLPEQPDPENELLIPKGDDIDTQKHKSKGTPIQLTWKEVFIQAIPPPAKGCCKKQEQGEPKTIIDHVSGTVLPGQFLAIIGASGAGKTTLLNYLSGRDISKNLDRQGEVLVNGTNRNQVSNFSAFSAYVQQDDILFQTMTVRECLMFAARLKLPGTYEEQENRVEHLIQQLKLSKCQNTKIGGPLVKGVSGGERKRTSIGVELITNPNLIFLDEPTTGLDSFTATSVMETLGDLAKKEGRTVVSTIHQPNSDIYSSFDRLLLMAKGKIIYMNKAELAVEYFASIDFQCPELSNPADYFMTMMSIESCEEQLENEHFETIEARKNAVKDKYAKAITYFDDKYQTNVEMKNNPDEVDPSATELDSNMATRMAPWCLQLGLLSERNFKNIIRLPQTSYVKLAVTMVTALFAMILYWDVSDDAAGVMNREGALFFITMNISFNAVQNVILIFPDEKPVFLREVNNNMYDVGPYFWGKVISELPVSILLPTIFGSMIYYAIGFNTEYPYKFALFLAILIILYNAASGYAFVIGTLVSDKALAVTLTPVILIPFMLFAGFFVASEDIPAWLTPFEYLSIFKYSYQALYLNEFTDLELSCMDESLPELEQCDPINDFNSPQDIGTSIWALIAIYIGCYGLSLIFLKMISSKYQ